MNGSSLVLDTNVVLQLLNGNPDLVELIHQKRIYLSFINQLELLSYSRLTKGELNQVEKFIGDCHVIDINEEIKNGVIALRKKYRLKLPDSIILATASFFELPFLTFDKDFEKIDYKNLIILEL
jgi:predicted nucleic acid-binding protein